MKRVFALAKVNNALRRYHTSGKSLTPVDKRLIKGFYINDPWALVNDSERENLKFKHKIDSGKAKDLVKKVTALKA